MNDRNNKTANRNNSHSCAGRQCAGGKRGRRRSKAIRRAILAAIIPSAVVASGAAFAQPGGPGHHGPRGPLGMVCAPPDADINHSVELTNDGILVSLTSNDAARADELRAHFGQVVERRAAFAAMSDEEREELRESRRAEHEARRAEFQQNIDVAWSRSDTSVVIDVTTEDAETLAMLHERADRPHRARGGRGGEDITRTVETTPNGTRTTISSSNERALDRAERIAERLASGEAPDRSERRGRRGASQDGDRRGRRGGDSDRRAAARELRQNTEMSVQDLDSGVLVRIQGASDEFTQALLSRAERRMERCAE